MKITMIGAGYVGLVSGACLADFGHDVTCVDADPGRVAALRAGRMPIFEPGLAELVAANATAGRLHFADHLTETHVAADAVFIAVGTPSRRGDGHADLSFVFQAARDIAALARQPGVVVTKSTVPVGTGDAVEALLRSGAPGMDLAVVSNPEFLREGAAIGDFKRPDRILIGCEDDRARAVMAEIYRPLFLNRAPILFTGRRTAELTKYAANAFLATKVTFINEMADLAEACGADIQDLARGLGLDNRIGPKFLHAGPGYGGSCFPKDTLALQHIAAERNTRLRIVDATVEANDARKVAMAERILTALGDQAQGATVAVLGLTFKPNTDDMRDAPALVIVPALIAAGIRVKAYDPEGLEHATARIAGLEPAADPYQAALGASAIVLMTEWDAFRALDLARLRAGMGAEAPILVDLRNVYAPDEARRAGFRYQGVGRGHGASSGIVSSGDLASSPARVQPRGDDGS